MIGTSRGLRSRAEKSANCSFLAPQAVAQQSGATKELISVLRSEYSGIFPDPR